MAIPPELQAALDENLSTQEVVNILRRYHSLPQKSHNDDKNKYKYKPPSWGDIWRGGYWDTWQPLRKYLADFAWSHEFLAPSDPLANIRRRLRGRIITWLCNAQREKNVFWILDPLVVPDLHIVTVRASYAARAFMGISEETNRFGVYINHVLTRDIHELVAKLAKACPQYRSLVARVLVEDPMITWKTIRVQLKRLIVEPWEIIRVSHPYYLSNPLLIIIDICDSKYKRQEYSETLDVFIELARDYSQSRRSSPLLWLFCSHPVPSIWRRLVQATYPVWCELWRASLNDAEAQRDTRYLLDEGFRMIRNRHNIHDTEAWPSEEQLSTLTKVISGVYYFADAVLAFIDCGRGKPQDQANACLKYMDGIPDPSVSAPFRTVDYFYDQVISDLPPDIQSDALRILEVLGNAHWVDRDHPRSLAHLIGMDQPGFSRVLDKLYSVLQISHWEPGPPYDTQIHTQTKELGSFLSFLCRRHHESPLVFRSFSRLLDSYPTIFSALKALRWTSSRPVDDFLSVGSLWRSAQSPFYFPYSDNPEVLPALCDCIRDFNFRHLISSPLLRFYLFLRWLYSIRVHLPDIVRTDAKNVFDHQLIEKCRNFAVPLELGDDDDGYFFLFPNNPPRYTLLGYDIRTVLVILCPDDDMYESAAATCYSLEMLDDM